MRIALVSLEVMSRYHLDVRVTDSEIKYSPEGSSSVSHKA